MEVRILKFLSGVYTVFGVLVMFAGMMIPLFLGGALANFFEGLPNFVMAGLIFLLSLLGALPGISLLAAGEFIRLMLSIEYHLNEQTYYIKKILKNQLVGKE